MRVTLWIDGVERTALLVESSWEIDSRAGSEIDTCRFTLDDQTNAISVVEGKEVLVKDYTTPTTYHFGGMVNSVIRRPNAVGRLIDCEAQDYTFQLHRATVTENYPAGTVDTEKEIIANAFTNSELIGYDASTYVVGDRVLDAIKCSAMTLADLLDLLAELTTKKWYMDYKKNLIYDIETHEAASFSLSDSPDNVNSFPYWGLTQVKDASKLANYIIVLGGMGRSGDTTKPFRGDGYTKTISIIEAWDAPSDDTTLQVWKNIGSDAVPNWSVQTVGIEGKDTLASKDCLWNPLAKRLEFAVAPPNLALAIQVRGRFRYRITTEWPHDKSIEDFGRQYRKVIRDPTLTTQTEVRDRAKREANLWAYPVEKLSLFFTHDGLVCGQYITVVNSILGISGDYYVSALTTRFLGGTVAEYKAELEAI